MVSFILKKKKKKRLVLKHKRLLVLKQSQVGSKYKSTLFSSKVFTAGHSHMQKLK